MSAVEIEQVKKALYITGKNSSYKP